MIADCLRCKHQDKLESESPCCDCENAYVVGTKEYYEHKLLFEPMVDETSSEDIIKHPNHYCREGAMECIDEMILIFGKEAVKHFCLCNIWKYRYRSSSKNGEEDINKSDEYVRIYKRLCSDERTEEDF